MSDDTINGTLHAILRPSPTSSPWIRRYPQPGFSRAKRSTSSRTSTAVAGRPGRRCGYVQRRATSSRCQRSSVAGDTTNDARAARGSTRLNAASSARSLGQSCGRATWLQQLQLMTQHEDLDLLHPLRAHPQHEQLEQPPRQPVQKRQHHAPRTTHLDNRAYRLSYPPPTPTTVDLDGGDRVSGTHTMPAGSRPPSRSPNKNLRPARGSGRAGQS
jgi:hypothetical protein